LKESCIAAVESTLGRDLGPGEADGIESRVRKWMRLLARRDAETWRGMSGTQRLDAAAKAAAQELMAEVSKARQQISLQIAAWDRAENMLAEMPQKTIKDHLSRLGALGRLMAFDAGKSGLRAVDSSAKAIQDEMKGALMDAWKVAHPKFFGLFESRQGVDNLIREIYAHDTGDAAAKAGAAAWRKVMDEARDRYNAAGGHIGSLGETYFPNHHDRFKVGNAGLDSWYKTIEPLLDKGKYLNVDGSNMSPKDLKEFFTHIFQTIITDGDSKSFKGPRQGEMIGPELMQQRASGHGLFADRNSQHRQVFFKDGDSFIDYQRQFGSQSFLSTMLGHVNRLGRDTAMLESQGPFAEQQFNALNMREALAAKLKFTDEKSLRDIDKAKAFNDSLFRYAAGQRDIVDSKVGQRFQAYRNIMAGLRLDKVVFTALSDEAGMAATAYANKVPYSEMLRNQLRVLNPLDKSHRESAESMGLGLNSMIGSINRYTQDDMAKGASGKFANFIMRVTGAERMWDARRQALSMAIMHSVGKLSRTVEHAKDLHEADHGMLARKGIPDKEWQVFRRADLNPDGAITPHEIWSIPDDKLKDLGNPLTLKRNATTALMAHAAEEAGMGVMETGIRERARIGKYFGDEQNTAWGQIGRTAMLFKTFTSSMVMKHWERMGSMGTLGSKAMYGTILSVYGTAIAAAVNALIRPFIAGQNPPKLDSKFLAQAILRGGGLGFYGDFITDQLNSRDESLGAALIGTLGTDTQDVWNVTGGAIFKKMKGQRTDEGAKLIRLARDNNPLLKTWYTEALWDHFLWYNLEEAANPGYLDRMQDRQRHFGRTYYWNPRDKVPTQGPDFGKMTR
jgi:hypothetical protein